MTEPVRNPVAPSDAQTLLLQVCLHEPASARQAWKTWLEQTAEPVRALGQRRGGARRLLPLLNRAVDEHDLRAGKALRTYLRTATTRDELRYATYRRLAKEALDAVDTSGFSFVLLKGAALAETVYPSPALRHSHDIDVLVGVDDLYRAGDVVAGLGWVRSRDQLGVGGAHIALTHASGLQLALHSNLFRMPHYRCPVSELWARTDRAALGGLRARILSPADALFHVGGHAATCESRTSLSWACDAWYLLARHPQLDWETVLDVAMRSGMALPLSRALTYLQEALGAPIPSHVLERLEEVGLAASPLAADIADFSTGTGITGKGRTWLHLRSWRSRVFIARTMLMTPLSYIRWAYELSHPVQSWFVSLYHPFRFWARYAWRFVRGRT